MVSWLLRVGCLVLVFGCTGPGTRVCTEMACADAATITTKLSAAGAPTGAHTFVVEVDGAASRCSVRFESASSIAYGECATPGTSLRIGPVMRGKETTMVIEGSSVVMHAEEPVPGEFEWQITVRGRPSAVRVVHSFADRPVVENTATFTYADVRPNGEGCEPVCKAAAVEWKGP